MARYRIETEYIVLDLARTILWADETGRCKNNVLGICTSLSSLYVTGNHKIRALDLFEDNGEEIKRNCEEEMLTKTILPQVIGVSDVGCAVQKSFGLSKVFGCCFDRTEIDVSM